MAYTTITKHTAHFNTKLYVGNGSVGNAQTGVGFQPDLVWVRNRPHARDNHFYDAVRGVNKVIGTDRQAGEATVTNGVTAFGADGFTVSDDANVNDNSDNHVAWCWKANGAGSTNTDGNNPNTVTVSANATSGFSIIKYQGTDTGGQTIGHGLGVKPKLFICKNLTESDNWMAWWDGDSDGDGTGEVRLIPNSTNNDYGNYPVTFGTSTITLPTQSDNAWNGNGDSFIGYCFAEKVGFSKIGKYKGNGSTDGVFIYTGFRPSFILIKSKTNNDWWGLWDNKRNTANPINKRLYAQSSDAEGTSDNLDFLSNGFKLKSTDGAINSSSGEYMYYVVGQSIVGTNNIPATAF